MENKYSCNYVKGGKQKTVYTDSEVSYVYCPLCQENDFNEIYKERNVLGIVKCLHCGLIYVNPRLKDSEKIYWGNAEDYFNEARLIFEGKATHHRDPNYIADLEIIRKYKPSGNFLDVGTNMGFFLRTAKDGQWNIYGVEPSSSLSEIARKHFGLNVKTAFLENADFDDSFFDIVTMTDVFEHVAEPKKLLDEVHRILKKDGILFIKVPNGLFNLFKLCSARICGKLSNYDIFDSYEHLVHFSQNTLNAMLERSGFKAVRFFISKPIQLPSWHKYVGQYFQYPTPWPLDFKHRLLRNLFYILSLAEFWIRFREIGYLAPNITVVAKKKI